MNVWLLDIDGVLVWSAGYRAALQATVSHFARALSRADYAPDDATVDQFEANGISSEWDSGPIIVAGLVLAAWQRRPAVTRSGQLGATLAAIRAADLPGLRPDFGALAERVAAARRPAESPAQTALRLLLADAQASSQAAADLPGLQAVLTGLLVETGLVPDNPVTTIFQHHALGSREYSATYGLPAEFDAPSLLDRHDRPALGAGWGARLQALAAGANLRAAILTARPSLPPSDDPSRNGESRPSGYAPEAELAAQMVGLGGLPVIGYGHMQWLGARARASAAGLVKPSPVHALSALAAAGGAGVPDSLLAAYALANDGRLAAPLHALNSTPLFVTVFEDSPGGILSAQAAAHLLAAHGIPVECRAFGIAASPAKRAALAALGAVVYDRVDEALDAAWATLAGH